MLEDQVAFLLQKYLGNYIRGLNKEALKISVWSGDVELTNMQLRPEALNALKLPVRVKAGFLGSVRLKVPWSRLGQEPVLVYLDRILLLAEPATQVQGSSEDAIQEAKKLRVRELETKMLESQQQLKHEMNASWLGSFISTIIGNIKLSISNIHIRYEDIESNPGHPFAAGVVLARLSAFTVDDFGKETFAAGGALDRIQKSVELDGLALYFDSNVRPWSVEKPWIDLHPSEWNKIFEMEVVDSRSVEAFSKDHSFILQPVSGNARYVKLRLDESRNTDTSQALQKAVVNLDSVTLCLSKDGYRDALKLVENFTAFNQRLKYAHYRPTVPIHAGPRSWWKYAYRVVIDEMKMASGKLSWDRLLKYARLRKRYVSLYASLLKADVNRLVVDDNKEIQDLDRELDIQLILQWRMLAHKFVQQSTEAELYLKKQNAKRSWWSIIWGGSGDESEHQGFAKEDWERLNELIGYKEGYKEQILISHDEGSLLHLCLDIHMKHNASRLITGGSVCLADLSCELIEFSIKSYSEAKVFDLKLGSYKLSSPFGLLAESATLSDSLVGVFSYKPLNTSVDWSFIAKASPCYMTYLKESVDGIATFFKSSSVVSHAVALETAAAVQMTIDGVKRTAQEQVTRALKDRSRFLLDLDIAAPKITIPTKFFPDDSHESKLMLDLGNLMLSTEELWECDTSEKDMYMQFNVVLTDVSAFLVDGDYHWGRLPNVSTSDSITSILPVIEKCGVVLTLQQIWLESPYYPSLRLAVRLPSLGFHFSPARYHRLMPVVKIFMDSDDLHEELIQPWKQADFEGWLSILSWKGIGSREAVWQRRYVCLVGPFIYVLENPASRAYRRYFRLSGKHLHLVPTEFSGGIENVLALIDAGQFNSKVVEDVNALIMRCDSDDIRKLWQNRLQATIYRASGSTAISSLSETSQMEGRKSNSSDDVLINSETMEKLFVTGVLDELKICFSCNMQSDRSFSNILLGNENQIFEIRAIGGQVQLLMKSNNILIGTLLKSLEIEDQLESTDITRLRYLARSFVGNAAGPSHMPDTVVQTDGEDNFFEALDNLDDPGDHPIMRQRSISEYFNAKRSLSSRKSSLRPPSFKRISGLIPDAWVQAENEDMKIGEDFDNFIRAQMVIYSQYSPLYNNLDNQVILSLAMLSFYCQRPTIVAILKFVDAINIQEDINVSHEKSSATPSRTSNANLIENVEPVVVQESAVIGLLGTGKNRIIFYLTLNMAEAQIFLMNENGTSLATLSQNNLLTDIKVFPTSFSIKAALGNLKISDDSLSRSHPYFWVCDMRNPGGSSFVELDFTSFSIDDDDYDGFDYSLVGQLSEVRMVYLHRFLQEVVSYFLGLMPSNTESVIKMKDKETNSEKWFTTSELEGSPAVKLDLSLRNPIILMPRKTDDLDYLMLDVLHITVQNTFHWFGGDKSVLNAVHLEIMTIKVQDINLIVVLGNVFGESIIQNVKALTVVIQRSLRDLLHQIPTTEVAINLEELKASLSSKEFEMITECALSNISETPHLVPMLNGQVGLPSHDIFQKEHSTASSSTATEAPEREIWVCMKVCVAVDLVELSLHSGIKRDSSLSIVQARGAWILYKSNSCGEALLFATLKGFSVVDDRDGIREEFRLAIGQSSNAGVSGFGIGSNDISPFYYARKGMVPKELGLLPVPSMLILDVKFKKKSTNISLCIQRPKLLVALDFLLAVVEFFVPSIRSILSGEEDGPPTGSATILEKPVYTQPSPEFFISPLRPLIADCEWSDHIIYDGGGGKLYLLERSGMLLSNPSCEMIVYVGNGKRLQFKNVTIVNGVFLDSCICLGANSSYSAIEDDHVFIVHETADPLLKSGHGMIGRAAAESSDSNSSTELIFEFQAIGPELTFYQASNEVDESLMLSNKVMHAQMDVFCRLVLNGDSSELNGSILGLNMESNGIRVLEPFDISVKFSNVSGKTTIHISASDIFMNFSFSILRLFIAVEEDILAFLRMTSKKASVICSQFDKVGTIYDRQNGLTYAFWRPYAPSGFAVLGHCLTPLNEPPSKGVLAVNTSLIKIKRPISFKLICTCSPVRSTGSDLDFSSSGSNYDSGEPGNSCSIWFPIAPKGYVAVGCVVSTGIMEPLLSSAFCILSSLVSPCSLKDCISLGLNEPSLEDSFWRVDNSFGTFLPANANYRSLCGKPYEFRHIIFGGPRPFETRRESGLQVNSQRHDPSSIQMETSALLNSGRLFEVVASFKLVWWNQGITFGKRLSIWRPICPPGMVYLGDVAVQGYESPNSAIVLHNRGDETFLKIPQDFQLVGRIKKHKGVESISFWLPQAPPGFVALGCICTKGVPKLDEFSSLRCIRNDMVAADQFSDESIWDASDTKVSGEPFSLWSVDSDVGTFHVRTHYKKPPRRFALKLVSPGLSSGTDNMIIDSEIKTFSIAVLDDYGGLMVPLFNISFSNIGFSLHSKSGCLHSTASFSLAARSYNDKHDLWEPLIEPMDGFVRYLYDDNAPGATTQLRITSTKDLNLNFSVSIANMLIQAYSSWNNLSSVHESHKKKEAIPLSYKEKSFFDIHKKKSYYIIPQNKVGRDIFMRVSEVSRNFNIMKLPSGDTKPVKVAVPKNMLDSHMRGNLSRTTRTLVTVIIGDGELPGTKGYTPREYSVTVRLFPNHHDLSFLKQQSARTCGAIADHSLSSGLTLVKWNEAIFFKIDSLDSYMVEFTVIELGRGERIGTYSAALKQLTFMLSSESYDSFDFELPWKELGTVDDMECQNGSNNKFCGRIKCCALLSLKNEINSNKQNLINPRRGFIQISPSREGPWTAVRLNYASRAACWRLGNDVVACEVAVKDGNRYVMIRSLVSVTNNTDFVIDLRLLSKDPKEHLKSLATEHEGEEYDNVVVETDEVFEVEKYVPFVGWITCLQNKSPLFLFKENLVDFQNEGMPNVDPPDDPPDGWEWIDDWHVEKTELSNPDGWVYAQDTEHLKQPESADHLNIENCARQRRWVRHRKFMPCERHVYLGPLNPQQSVPLPLSAMTHPTLSYVLQLKPRISNDNNEYSWSIVLEKAFHHEITMKPDISREINVSNLTASHEVLYCSSFSESSSKEVAGLWFCVSIESTETGKDIHSDPIQDWIIQINSPISITNFLPNMAEYTINYENSGGGKVTRSQGMFAPGETRKIYNTDLRNPLYFSLSIPPPGEWQPTHEPVLISHARQMPSKVISLRSSLSGRISQVILEQNFDNDHFMEKSIRIYAPYWISSARCPPLNFFFIEMLGKGETKQFISRLNSERITQKILFTVTEDDFNGGCSIMSALTFKLLGLSLSFGPSGKECYGDIKCISPLGDMDGSIDLCAYDSEGNCFHAFISSKPSPYSAVPTKVISIRPFMTFTNRIGQDIYIKLSSEDQPKVLHTYHSRESFIYQKAQGQDKLQIRLEDTNWCFPVEITKEGTMIVVLRKYQGGRTLVKSEVRGYEDGSRFLVVFRLGPAEGPIRFENRISDARINIRQSGFDDNAWIALEPCSSTNFSWEDPSLQKLVDIVILRGSVSYISNVSLEKTSENLAIFKDHRMQLNVLEVGDIKMVQFINDRTALQEIPDHQVSSNHYDASLQEEMVGNPMPFELIVELGVVGVSLTDHRPRELLYLYLEKVFVSYCTGYDAGTTSRFKLIVGQLQLDNQLPLTLMPVLLAPEELPDINHPVFKATITMINENVDGVQIYPYVYIRVAERCWRLNVHEPIIWALMDFYSNLHMSSASSNSGVTQADPEIRIDLIDVSEVRLKLSLETEPTQRPPGVLGFWSPVLSAVGNAFKIQVHLRKVMHKGRFLRRSSIVPAILNRIRRDLVHNPLHLILSVDVLSMTKSTFSSLSKGIAEMSTDGQFLQLRSKQVWSRRITGVRDGILQGTEALAQGVAFGVSGVLTKPVESARQNGLLGLAHGLGHAFVGFITQPLSGALDFMSLTVGGISASYAKCINILSNKSLARRIRNPRAIRVDGILREYCEREAIGQMVLYLAETSRHLGCTDLFKEPSKYAWSDYYEDNFMVPYQRIVLITNKRVMLLQCLDPKKLDKKPSKILWDVPWEDILALELAKAGYQKPSCLIIHLKYFRSSETFVRLIKCNIEEDDDEPQALKICSSTRTMWRRHQSNMKVMTLKVPASQRYVQFAWDEENGGDSYKKTRPVIKRRGIASESSHSNERKFVKHSMNFEKIWSSEQECKRRCTMFLQQVGDESTICSIWRPFCPDGYVSVGDVAHVGVHPPNVAAVYRHSGGNFAVPTGYDLVWRSCPEDYPTPLTIWTPRPPDGFVAIGCVAVPDFAEPDLDAAYCVSSRLAEATSFEEQVLWTAPDMYPWACHIYQVRSEALQFVALRYPKEVSDWKSMRVADSEGTLKELEEPSGTGRSARAGSSELQLDG